MSATILVLEDNEDCAFLLSAMLSGAGYKAVTLTNGIEGIQYLQHHSLPDLIISDLRMPKLGGDGFVNEVRRHPEWANTRIILFSNEPSLGTVAARLGVPGLPKSAICSRESLLAEVRRQVAH